jgi:hypothetical protein
MEGAPEAEARKKLPKTFLIVPKTFLEGIGGFP